jgi:O-antigen/teichoic acid export membrane protein
MPISDPESTGAPSAVARLRTLATGWRNPQNRDGMALVLAAASWLVLMVFGPHYAATGSILLALAAFSAIPACVNLAAVAAARVSQNRVGQFATTLAIAVIVIPAVWVLMPIWGLTGVGVALVGGQTVVAVAVLLRVARRPA